MNPRLIATLETLRSMLEHVRGAGTDVENEIVEHIHALIIILLSHRNDPITKHDIDRLSTLIASTQRNLVNAKQYMERA